MNTYTRTDGSEVTYLSCAETAKLLRKALKQAFPTTKFSVRSKTYSGGASIRVGWTDGPTSKRVDAVAQLYAGASFDGMIDLKSHHDSILVDESGEAKVYSFGADYVFTERRESETVERKLYHEIAEFAGIEVPQMADRYNKLLPVACDARYWNEPGAGLAVDTHGGEYLTTLVGQLFGGRDYEKSCRHEEYGTYTAGLNVFRCRGCGMRAKRHIEREET